jgi:hypothetical protein
MTITVPRINAQTVGALIALFERAVGLYASLVGINAYHQPGVEAGKQAAASVLALQGKIVEALSAIPQTADQIAAAVATREQTETVYLLLEHLAANGRARLHRRTRPDDIAPSERIRRNEHPTASQARATNDDDDTPVRRTMVTAAGCCRTRCRAAAPDARLLART